jgi:putative DNA primase/helicase
MTTLPAIARALGGEVRGRQVLAPGLGHSRRDRSLSIRLDPGAPGGLLVHSFAGDDPLVAKDYVRQQLGLPRCDTVLQARPAGERPSEAIRLGKAESMPRALAIWREACDPVGSPVEGYLRRRRVDLPRAAIGEVIRFHPSCPFAGERVLAMVCLARDVVTNEPRAIHRTALSRDGGKLEVHGTSRLSLGPTAGAAVKLSPDEEVTTCLGVAEGIETALSMRLVPEFGTSPVWSLISAGGLAQFPVLPGIECLWVGVDHDAAGLKASRAAATRWRTSGAEAFLITPSEPRADLNDLFRAGAIHA